MRVAKALLLLILCSACSAVGGGFEVMVQEYIGDCTPPVEYMPCCLSAPRKKTITFVAETGDKFRISTDYAGNGRVLLLPGRYIVQFEGCDEKTEEMEITVSEIGISYDKNAVTESGEDLILKQVERNFLEININCCTTG